MSDASSQSYKNQCIFEENALQKYKYLSKEEMYNELKKQHQLLKDLEQKCKEVNNAFRKAEFDYSQLGSAYDLLHIK